MLGHYLISALRNSWRYRLSTAGNIFGLTLGMVCFVFLYGQVAIMENSDRNMPNADRIYVIAQKYSDDAASGMVGSSPAFLADVLRTDFPGLSAVSRTASGGIAVVSAGDKRVSLQITYADSDFLRTFTLPLLHGEPASALASARSMVMMREEAEKLFGRADVVGRTVTIRGVDLAITGIIDKLPEPTHLKFGALVSLDIAAAWKRETTGPDAWSRMGRTYILFPESGQPAVAAFNAQLPAFVRRHLPPEAEIVFEARPIAEISTLVLTVFGRPNHALLILASLVLGVACVNYAIFATAQVVNRLKETGLRKVLGARRNQIIGQHLIEVAVHVMSSLTIAVLAAAAALPIFNRVNDFNVGAFLAYTPAFWIALLAAVGSTSLIAGVYPALLLSRAAPEDTLRNAVSHVHSGWGLKAFVGVQFAMASLLLIIAFIANTQFSALLATAPDTSGDPLVVIRGVNSSEVNQEVLRSEIVQSPEVKSFTSMAGLPFGGDIGSPVVLTRSPDASAAAFSSVRRSISYDYFDVFDIRLLAGRSFAREIGEDMRPLTAGDTDQAPYNVVVDRTFTRGMGWTPQDAIGQTLYSWPTQGVGRRMEGQAPTPIHIIGVAENSALFPMTLGGVKSAIYVIRPSLETAVVRVSQEGLTAALSHIDAVWSRAAPNVPIHRRLLEEVMEEFEKVGGGILRTGLSVVVGLAFTVAISGLLAMAVYVTARRKREIGIRKTLGSSVFSIVRLLLLNFSKPIVIGSVLVWPVAFLIARQFLSFLTAPAPLTLWPFVLGLVIAVMIGWLAVIIPAWRAARVNPADVLHYE